MPNIVFVVLHYNTIEMTTMCIDSIINNIHYKPYRIVVVDNNSPNGTGQLLKEKYLNNNNIDFLLLPENIGFAKGNNAGYKYAKEVLGADFIIIHHNDVVFVDDMFVEKTLTIYNNTGFGILGPKIISKRTQNPHKMHLVTRDEVKKILNFYRREKIKLFLMSTIRVTGVYELMRKIKRSVKTKKTNQVIMPEQMTDVTLHAACIVFSPKFIKEFDYAFYPEVFMFFDEDLLHYMCAKHNLKVLFDPSLSVDHKESKATESVAKTPLNKSIFINKHIIKSVEILYKLMQEDNYYTVRDFKKKVV